MDPVNAVRCPNCGSGGIGKYCANCGSVLRTQLPTVTELGAEITTEVFVGHQRAPLTLWAFLVKPGLVIEAIRGGVGARFTSPVKMYLGLSAVYFVMVAASNRQMFPRFSELRTDIVAVITVPIFGLWLKVFYGLIGGARVHVSESISFALTFQCALFVLWMPMLWFPDAWQPGAVAVWGIYSVWYIWSGARRLWDDRGTLGLIRALAMTITYVASSQLSAVVLTDLWSAIT